MLLIGLIALWFLSIVGFFVYVIRYKIDLEKQLEIISMLISYSGLAIFGFGFGCWICKELDIEIFEAMTLLAGFALLETVTWSIIFIVVPNFLVIKDFICCLVELIYRRVRFYLFR